jgi:hypothetical protein
MPGKRSLVVSPKRRRDFGLAGTVRRSNFLVVRPVNAGPPGDWTVETSPNRLKRNTGAIQMRMTVWAGVIGACAAAATLAGAAQPASAQELSEKSVRSFMDYAWSLTPQQFSKQDGTVIVIDKKKKD